LPLLIKGMEVDGWNIGNVKKTRAGRHEKRNGIPAQEYPVSVDLNITAITEKLLASGTFSISLIK